MKTANQYLNAILGGGNGGKCITSPLTTGTYDFIVITEGTIFTVMEDSAATDLLAAKALSGVTISGGDKVLNSGTGLKIKKLTYTGGQVYGYTFDTTGV